MTLSIEELRAELAKRTGERDHFRAKLKNTSRLVQSLYEKRRLLRGNLKRLEVKIHKTRQVLSD